MSSVKIYQFLSLLFKFLLSINGTIIATYVVIFSAMSGAEDTIEEVIIDAKQQVQQTILGLSTIVLSDEELLSKQRRHEIF